MKRSFKVSLVVVPLILLACLACLIGLIWLGSQPDEPISAGASVTSGNPLFEVSVEKDRMDRFLGGILPRKLEAKLVGDELRFDHASRGAKIGLVEPHHLELSADGWELLIETDAEGKVTAETRLIFPINIANVDWTLRCRPADPAVGYLKTTSRSATSESKTFNVLDGRFVIEIARCEDAKTGEILDTEAGGESGDAWPSSPLTLRGSFAGLPSGRR